MIYLHDKYIISWCCHYIVCPPESLEVSFKVLHYIETRPKGNSGDVTDISLSVL